MFLRIFRKNEGGNVLIMTGLSILVLFAAGGSAVDFGRQQLVRAKVQQASDAAALAAASLPTGTTSSQRSAAAQRYFNLNYPDGYLGIARPTPVINVGATISVSATASVPSFFVSNIGVDQLDAEGASVVSVIAQVTEIKNDVLLLFDNSGSMSTADAGGGMKRLDAMKSAATIFNNALLDGKGAAQNKIGLVKWDTKVIGTQNLTNNKPTVTTFINGLKAAGGTDSSKGTAQARLMMPQFRNDSIRAIVLLTDGSNNPAKPSTRAQADAATLADCKYFKEQSPVYMVFTIALGNDVNKDKKAAALLQGCASGDSKTNEGKYFFRAYTEDDLQQVFQTIVAGIKKVRIAE